MRFLGPTPLVGSGVLMVCLVLVRFSRLGCCVMLGDLCCGQSVAGEGHSRFIRLCGTFRRDTVIGSGRRSRIAERDGRGGRLVVVGRLLLRLEMDSFVVLLCRVCVGRLVRLARRIEGVLPRFRLKVSP